MSLVPLFSLIGETNKKWKQNKEVVVDPNYRREIDHSTAQQTASFCLFFVFSKQTLQSVQQYNVKICPSSVRCWVSNPQPLECQSPPITPWLGLRPIQTVDLVQLKCTVVQTSPYHILFFLHLFEQCGRSIIRGKKSIFSSHSCRPLLPNSKKRQFFRPVSTERRNWVLPLSPVWPDTGLKSSPMFFKGCPKIATRVFLT